MFENLFEREITIGSYKNSAVRILQSKASEITFRNPKRPMKINNGRNNSKENKLRHRKSDTQDKNKCNQNFIDGKEIKELITVQRMLLFTLETPSLKILKVGRCPLGKMIFLCNIYLVRRLIT